MYSGPLLLLLFTQSEFPQGTVSFPTGWAQASVAPTFGAVPHLCGATHTFLRPLLNLPRTHSHFF